MQYGPRYNWTKTDQSLLLGSYFWGYLITSLPGGLLAEWLGGRAVVGYTLAGSAICTALTPIAADFSYWIVFTIRFITGILAVGSLFSIYLLDIFFSQFCEMKDLFSCDKRFLAIWQILRSKCMENRFRFSPDKQNIEIYSSRNVLMKTTKCYFLSLTSKHTKQVVKSLNFTIMVG